MITAGATAPPSCSPETGIRSRSLAHLQEMV